MIAINELNIEDYVKGVLPYEMSPRLANRSFEISSGCGRELTLCFIY